MRTNKDEGFLLCYTQIFEEPKSRSKQCSSFSVPLSFSAFGLSARRVLGGGCAVQPAELLDAAALVVVQRVAVLVHRDGGICVTQEPGQRDNVHALLQ